MHRILAVVLIAIGTNMLWNNAAFANCGCNFYPIPGGYGEGDLSFDLSYIDGSNYSCPTQMRIQANRRDAADADVMLMCSDGIWTGSEYTRAGVFGWQVSGAIDYSDIDSRFRSTLELSAGIADQLTITLIPPLQTIGRPPRSQTVSVNSQSKAPDCFCTALKDTIEHAEKMIAAFSDQRVLNYAMRNNLRADDNSSKSYMTGDGVIREYAGEAGSQYSYTQMVDAVADGELKWRDGAPHIENPTAQGSGTSDPSSVDAAAFTNSGCKVKLGSEERKTCKTAWELKATLIHENTHRRQCLAKHKLSKYTLPSGHIVYPNGDNPNSAFEGAYGKDIVERSGGLMIAGTLRTLDLKRFGDYSSLPANRSAMEIEAYTEERNFSQFMDTKYCR